MEKIHFQLKNIEYGFILEEKQYIVYMFFFVNNSARQPLTVFHVDTIAKVKRKVKNPYQRQTV
jgi:hypothetical protein